MAGTRSSRSRTRPGTRPPAWWRTATCRSGTRVTVEPDLPCWDCKNCRTGRENICENLRFFGCAHDQGGMAEYFTIDVRRLHVVPDDLDWPTAALIEPLSTPVHAIRLAGDVRDRTVAILGAGTIGLLISRVARAHGARRIVLTARSAASRERALRFGADAAVDATAADAVEQVRKALGESADVVFDCVAEQSTMAQAIGMANKGGTVMVIGVPAGEVSIPLQTVQDSQLRIQGSATYLPEDYTDAIELLRAGVVTAAEFVTATRPLSGRRGRLPRRRERRAHQGAAHAGELTAPRFVDGITLWRRSSGAPNVP